MSRLVEAARRYLGVRFSHRGRSTRALDCAGLAWRAYYDCGVVLPDVRTYGREPHNDGLVQHVRAALGQEFAAAPVRESQLQAGDIVLMRFQVEPHHVAIVTDYQFGGLGLIHADGQAGRVLQHRLAPDMVKRITHAFRRPVE